MFKIFFAVAAWLVLLELVIKYINRRIEIRFYKSLERSQKWHI